MVKVQLYGELGKTFGKVYRFDITSPADAIRALRANFPEFEQHLITASERGMGYKIIAGKEALSSEKDVLLPTGQQTIKIIPVIKGAAKSPYVQILEGAALIALVVFAPELGLPLIAQGTIGGSIVAGIGISLALGGVSQLLAPSPKGGPTAPTNAPSYIFNGAVNVNAQGQPVPVGYGRLIVGSSVISAGINTEDTAT